MNEQDHQYYLKNALKMPDATIYRYGSRVYGTHNAESDYDYIIVDETATNGEEFVLYPSKDQMLNVHLYTPDHWRDMIKLHKIFAMECIFQDEDDPWRKDFKLNLGVLREEISQKSSNSWVKAKKKLIVEHEIRNGLKSLFHSFRILDFGIQIAKNGKITNYSSCNTIYKEIMDSPIGVFSDDPERQGHSYYDVLWDKLHECYKKMHNEWSSEFKTLAPKMK